ncbi:hypothetical protein ABH15_01525 [Methanoculleus taiwanensis]|uniref:histidine kinase n=1 Tax=Methanoculleus taiwanensis TaxID=1550565 RepID=A0A498H1Y5_9EURY|nr:PAS domain S-box protein [Methanoculleus taiwanensis]RXE56862.1 hypothetical protein ABH15_01525 [Methanoculleus taiwanensis]
MNARPLEEEIESVRRRLNMLSCGAHPDRTEGDLAKKISGLFEALLAEREDLLEKNARLARSRDAEEDMLAHYRDLFTSAPEAYIETDPCGTITAANAAAEALFGFAGTTPVGKPLLLYTSPESRKALFSAIGRLHAGAENPPWEGTLRPPNQKPVTVAGTVGAAYAPDGRLSSLRWILRETTGERTSCEDVRETLVLLEGIFDNIGDIVGIQTPDRRVIRYNRAGYESLGVKPEEAIGRRCYEVIGRSSPCPVCASARVHESGKTEVVEKYVPELGRHLECRASPVLNEAGEVTMIIEQLIDITDRVSAAEALERVNAYNRSLIEASPDPMAVIDPGGIITDLNAATERITGKTRDEIIGTAFAACFTDPERALTGFAAVFEAGTVRDYPLELLHRDGHTTPILCNSSVFRNAGGSIVGVIAAARDVTELRRAEEAVRESERRYRHLIENLNEGIWQTDPEGITTYVNPQMAALLGYTSEEMHGMHLFTFMDEAGIALARAGLDRRSRGIRDQREFTFLRKDKSRVRTLVSAAPLIDDEGVYRGSIAAVLDVTELHRAERALRASEERYRSFVQNLQGIAFHGTLDLRPLFLHGSVLEITGYTEREIIGGVKRWELLIHPDDRERMEESTRQLTTAPGHISDREYRIIRKDGTIRWLRELSRNVPDEAGHPIRIEGMLYDITARKEAEEALRESERKYREITRRSFDMIYTCYHREGITFITPAVERVLGYTPEELVGTICRDYVAPESRPVWEKAYRTIAAGIPVEGIQIRFRRKDGTYALVELNESPIFRDGLVVGVQAAGRDITERKKAEEALRASEERFRSIFEESPIGIQVYDAAGRLLTINDACVGIFGFYDCNGLQEFNLFEDPNLPEAELLHLKDGEVVRCRIAYDFEEVKRRNLYGTTRSGCIFLDLLITPISPVERGGAPESYMLQVQDITEQVRMEALKQEAYERINKNIEQFAILGDHVRQPLQVILGLAELIDDDRTGKIIDEVRRINGIIKQLDQGWVESRKVREFLQRNE